jgi:hypothetical protein
MSENCDEIRTKVEDELSRGLSVEERKSVDLHIKSCEDCRRYRETLRLDDERLDALAASISGLASRIEDGVMKAPVSRVNPVGNLSPRWISRPVTRVAAAVVVIFGIALVSHFVDRNSSSDVIWANVFRQVEQSTGFTARGTLELNGNSFEIILYESDEFGQKHEIYQYGNLVSRTFLDFARGTDISIQYDDSTYSQFSGPSEARDESIFDVVAGLKESNHTSLGIAEIEGITTSGIEVADTVLFNGIRTIQITRVYVDIETQWPVRIELDTDLGVSGLRTVLILENFVWHNPFERSDFEPVIPDGFRPAYSPPGGGN